VDYIGWRFQRVSSSGCVCWPTAASIALCLITLLRPSVQSLAVAHVITSDPLRYQPYWCRPRVIWLSETGHSRWLPHGHGMPYRNSVQNAPSLPVFRRELKTVLFQSSFTDAIWQWAVLYLHDRRSMPLSHHVYMHNSQYRYYWKSHHLTEHVQAPIRLPQ